MAEILEFIIKGKDEFSAAFKKVEAELSTTRGAFKSAAGSVSELAGAFGGLGTLSTGAIFAAMTKSAIDFQASMANVSTLVDTTKINMAKFESAILSLAPKVGQSTTELSNGLYEVISAGVAAGDSVAVLEVSAKAAAAGLTTTKTAVDVITSTINSYGLSADKASQVSDILFTTVKLGKTNFEQLAGSIGGVLPLAAQLNVGFDEVGAAMATLTAGGIQTAEAATAIKSTFAGMIQNAEKFRAKGVDIQKILSEQGLTGALRKLSEMTGGNTEEIRKLLPEVNSLGLVLSLTGKMAGAFSNNLQATREGLGETERAFEKQTDTAEFAMKQLSAAFSVLSARVGTVLLPIFTEVVKAITWCIEAFISLGEGIGKVAATIPAAVEYGFGKVGEIIFGFVKWLQEQMLDVYEAINVGGAFDDTIARMNSSIKQNEKTMAEFVATQKKARAEIDAIWSPDIAVKPAAGGAGIAGLGTSTTGGPKPAPGGGTLSKIEQKAIDDRKKAIEDANKAWEDAMLSQRQKLEIQRDKDLAAVGNDEIAKAQIKETFLKKIADLEEKDAEARQKRIDDANRLWEESTLTAIQRLELERDRALKNVVAGSEEELKISQAYAKKIGDAEKQIADDKNAQLDRVLQMYKEQFYSQEQMLWDWKGRELAITDGSAQQKFIIEQIYHDKLMKLKEEELQKEREKNASVLEDRSKTLQGWVDQLQSIGKSSEGSTAQIANMAAALTKSAQQFTDLQAKTTKQGLDFGFGTEMLDKQNEKLQQNHDKSMERLAEWYAVELEKNKANSTAMMELEKSYKSQQLDLESKFTEQKDALYQQDADNKITLAQTAMQTVMSVAAAGGKKYFGIYKAAAIAQTTIATYEAAMKAYSSLANIPYVGAVLGAAAAAAIIAFGMARVSLISQQQYTASAHGGLTNVPKEETYLLDKGERVLSPNQNKDLIEFMGKGESGGGTTIIENVNVHVLENATNTASMLAMSKSDWETIAGEKIVPALRNLKLAGITV